MLLFQAGQQTRIKQGRFAHPSLSIEEQHRIAFGLHKLVKEFTDHPAATKKYSRMASLKAVEADKGTVRQPNAVWQLRETQVGIIRRSRELPLFGCLIFGPNVE